MCDPVTLTIAATTIAAAGSVYGGFAANANSRYAAKVADRNATLANEQARDSLDRGQLEAQRHYRRAAQLEGQQTAAMAANGIDIGFGSAARVAEDTAMYRQEDARTIYENTLRETKGFEINSANYTSEAQARRMQGKAQVIGGFFNAGSSILSGASQVSKLRAGQNFGG